MYTYLFYSRDSMHAFATLVFIVALQYVLDLQ